MATLKLAAQRLGCSPDAVRRWVKLGDIRATKDASVSPPQWVIQDDELERFAKLRAGEVEPDALESAVASEVEGLTAQVARLVTAVTDHVSTMGKPLALYLEHLERLLAPSHARCSQLEATIATGWQTQQAALDLSLERDLQRTAASKSAELRERSLEWLMKEIPEALRYGRIARHLRTLAPLLAGAFPQSAVDALTSDPDLTPEQQAALGEFMSAIRAEATR